MRVLSTTVSDEVAAAFDAIARTRSGRARLLRSLIEKAMAATPAGSAPPAIDEPRGPKRQVLLYMASKDVDAVEREASAMGFSRSAWIVALVRRRLGGRLRFSREGELALILVHGELRRLRAGMLQTVRALEAEPGLADRAGEVANLAAELGSQMAGVRAAMEGNVRYWEVGNE